MDASACSAATAAKSKFVPWTWSQTSFGNTGVFALPQDTGPMALYVRSDIFKKHGIAIPKTWDEYAAAAAKLHKADSSLDITFFDPNNAEWFNGLLWQNNSQMYSYSGDKWQVTVASKQSKAGRRLLAEADRGQARAHRPRQRFDADVRGLPEGPDRQLRRRGLGLQHVPRQPPQAVREVVDRPDADVGLRRRLR